ncbi:hypothetical protein QVD17_28644 [Tagetes erecta]|uniref:Uncharacterized protein n=1 Tax=Tagetes erecta TaxID=13708 RepID=A0AAD8KFE4_TARER|nr:hypothetical protein QVD17_28644 [Tagetes erecta]
MLKSILKNPRSLNHDPIGKEDCAESLTTGEAPLHNDQVLSKKTNGVSYADKLNEGVKVNFRHLESDEKVGDAGVVLPRESVLNMKNKFANTLELEEIETNIDQDGFQPVNKSKSSSKPKFQVGKQKQKFEYRPVDRNGPKITNGSNPNNPVTQIKVSNKFESLTADPGTSKRGLDDLESLDGEEVYNETDAFMKEDIHTFKPDSEGASTPGEDGLND